MAKRNSSNPKDSTFEIAAKDARALLEQYLTQVRDIHATGAAVPETSYYPALANLFNAVGKTLKPAVHCVMNLRQQGAGMPDGGLFTADQLRRDPKPGSKREQIPSRGAIEAKSPSESVATVAESKQVRDYLSGYGIVVVTNFREFLIVERGTGDHPVSRESFSLAEDDASFWRKAAHPRTAADELAGQFIEFLKRACLHNAPLINPKDVAWFLASYARDALARVERKRDLPALLAVRDSLEESLGMRFTDEQGEHFFRSTLVQTIFYGVFSAWVLWHRENRGSKEVFDWKNAAWSLHVPFIRTLYEEIAKPARLGELKLVEVLEWTGNVLNRVDPAEFFKRFEDEHAVQYFYEPFLEAYDPDLRKAVGVWYTPPEIVKYQVARVDTVLREELNLPNGLADPNVVVLDPCCGTGAYLVEVLHRIAETLRANGGDALIASDLKKAAMEQVFGFEILPAPFVVAHLQLSLLLQKLSAPLSNARNERVAVYLTNALTGWEPPKQPKSQLPLPFPELREERDAAERVKRGKKILVVLGNPPYNAFAGVSPEEEQGLVEPYKKDLNKPVSAGGWGIKKFNLDDLYVRFFRLAERRIAEMTGQGIVSFISNFSYLSDPSFVVMRQRFLSEFDQIWIDCMNGDSRETGKLTPDGKPDPSVFSTEYNREGIRVGTAVCVIVRKPVRQKKPVVRFRHFWGVTKRSDLLRSVSSRQSGSAYSNANPSSDNWFSSRPDNVANHYMDWPKLTDLCAIAPSNGLMEKRGGTLIDIERNKLQARMREYFDPDLTWAEYKSTKTGLTRDAARFSASKARAKAIATETFDPRRLCRYAVRAFDTRWCYYTPVRPVWNEPRPTLWSQFWEGNSFLVTRFRTSADIEGSPVFFTTALLDDHLIIPDAVAIPIRLRNGERLTERQHATLFDMLDEPPNDDEPVANLSAETRSYLERLKIKGLDSGAKVAGCVWMHALAVGFSPAYLSDNNDGIRRDWPRIPMPDSGKQLKASAALGEKIAAILDTQEGIPGLTVGKVGPLSSTVGLVSKHGRSEIDLSLTAGWGHAGKGGVTMPAKGKSVERSYDETETAAIEAEAKLRRMSASDVLNLLGVKTLDVYLNAAAYWRNIPVNVWEFRIGGYQVIKKWLSYREFELLGRSLTTEEAREVTGIVRRIAAIILLQPQLDENYRAIKASPFDWATLGAS